MQIINCPLDQVTDEKIRINEMAIRKLEDEGFTVIGHFLGGEEGGVIYFTASSLPIKLNPEAALISNYALLKAEQEKKNKLQ